MPLSDGAGIVRVMYVFFLGVVPFISLCLFFIYYWRQNRPQFMRNPVNVYVENVFKRLDCAQQLPNECKVHVAMSAKPRPTIGATTLISSTNPRVWTVDSERAG